MIYTPGFIYSMYELSKLLPLTVNQPSILTGMLAIHFLKRLFEVFTVHNYTSKTDAPLAGFIGIYYAFCSYIILSLHKLVPATLLNCGMVKSGLLLFIIGEVGNLYHHIILSNLRKKKTNTYSISKPKTYVNPTGGLFNLIATPHYLFELLAWLGIACV